MAKKFKLELDWDLTDGLVVEVLKEHRKMSKDSIKNLKKIKKLEPYQAEDLANSMALVNSLNEVLAYFGEK